jgi:hypothetical protein
VRATPLAAPSTGSAIPHDRIVKVNSHSRCELLDGDSQPSGFFSNKGKKRSTASAPTAASAPARPRHAPLAATATGTRTPCPASTSTPTATATESVDAPPRLALDVGEDNRDAHERYPEQQEQQQSVIPE